MPQDEDRYYEAVAAELQTQQMKPGLWAKAYAQTEGDEARTLAVYIHLRVQQMVDNEKQNALQQRRLLQEQYRLQAELKHHDIPAMIADVAKVGRVRDMLKWFGIIGVVLVVVTVVAVIAVLYLRAK